MAINKNYISNKDIYINYLLRYNKSINLFIYFFY